MKIGIIGAMDVEVTYLKNNLQNAQAQTIAGMEFAEGTFADVPVVVVFCSVGKVNAGICVQILADCFGVTHVINTGVAGSLDVAINIGDLVVSTDAIYHDMDVQNFGYAPGQVPGFKVVAFPADPELRALIETAAAEVAPDIQVFPGRVASGDQFIRTAEAKQRIIDTFAARCCEMEGAAIAHACYLNDIPFVVVRAISDKADGSDAELYPVFEEKAAKHCAAIVEYAVKKLA
ncbi:MAG: 5'-methylthioadenosine/adenosylhomocysteine nucleosidase [Eggerthellales bacterium]|nr:5'-methylthioadenosine/adenosylhomocysteine nucleosidase [Eggerthellales bacterium]